ncbi:MAG: tetratricopeptide repeat protein, partial [Zoogloea sp.]|nr:tetratricopeptide repeat protein [Zoogloea sp.]
FRKSLAALEQVFGAEHPELLPSLNGLAAISLANGEQNEYDGYSKRVLAVQSAFLGPDNPVVLDMLERQADSYLARRRYVDARPLYERLVSGSELRLGSGSPAFEALLRKLAAIHQANGNGAEAEKLYRRVLALRESRPDADRDPSIPTLRLMLADLEFAQQRYADAASDYRFLLETRSAVFNDDNAQTGVILNNLGESLRLQGRPDEAEPCYRRAIVILRRTSGGANAELANAENNLGVSLFSRRAGPEAAEHLLEALRIREAILPADDLDLATSLNNVATERVARGDYQGALPLLERARLIVDKKPAAVQLRATVAQMLESAKALARSKAEQK